MIFSIATAAVVIPMIVYRIAKAKGKAGNINSLGEHEKTFEETFPKLND